MDYMTFICDIINIYLDGSHTISYNGTEVVVERVRENKGKRKTVTIT